MGIDLDWERGHGPVTGPVNGAAGALAASYAGHLAHLPWQWGAGAAGVALLGHHLAGLRHKLSRGALALRAASWTAAGGWTSYALAHGPWHPATLTALGGLGAGLGVAWAGERRHEQAAKAREAEAKARRQAPAVRRGKLAGEWEERIARVCNVAGVEIVNVEDWDTGGGFTLDGETPQGGSTWRHIKQYEDGLAADARLPEGCGVEVTAGAHRGAFLINVATVNRLIDDAPYPSDYSRLSVNGVAPLGVYRDGTLTGTVMRQATALIVGQKGSGKTNLQNVVIGNSARMDDELQWIIDLNGGNLALPWLRLWEKAGRPGRPPIDWVADTPERALAMAEAALAIAVARKTGYKDLEIEANDDKLPVSAKVPAIAIRGDEIAEFFSARARQDPVLRKAGDTFIRVIELARASAVNMVNAALRATQDVISEGQILKQSTVRVGMRMADEAEMHYLFGWRDKAVPEDAPYPGCGFIKVGNDPARPFKAYRITPQQIAEIVAATAERHPVLDELSARAAGEAYARRWDGMDHLFSGAAPAGQPVAAAAVDFGKPEPEQGGRRPVTADWGKSEPPASVADAIADAEARRDRLRAAMDENLQRDPDLDQRFREILGGGGAIWSKPVDEPEPAAALEARPGEDSRKPLVFDIVLGAGPSGISPKAVQGEFQAKHPTLPVPSRSAITDWLKDDPRIDQPARGLYAVKEEHR